MSSTPPLATLSDQVELTGLASACAHDTLTWRGWLLGPEGARREAIQRLFVMAPSYLLIGVLLLGAVHLGLAPRDETLWVLAYALFGLLAFWMALRAGLGRRAPLLLLPQLCFNLSVVVLAYALVPITRGLAVQWLCLLILFDMQRLSGREVLGAAALAYGLLIGAMWAIYRTAPDHIDLAAEAVNICMAGVTLCALLAVTRVGRRVQAQRQAQQARLAETVAQLDKLAMYDGLTGAYNRRHMQAMMDKEWRRQQRNGRPFCVALLDIDHFKRVNDILGHAMGDLVLREVVRLLREALPVSVALGRWGGEEFTVLLPEYELDEARALLLEATKAVREHGWSAHAPGLAVTLSGGVSAKPSEAPRQWAGPAQILSQEGSLATLLDRADQALYAAKAAGRDRVHPA
jgi:diguanylate cyclase (GGDEF)-like protein